MKELKLYTKNIGKTDVRITVETTEPVEFANHIATDGPNSAIYASGALVSFRLAGKEPSAWMNTTATRHAFSTARVFDVGA
jgi:hypothetical protein